MERRAERLRSEAQSLEPRVPGCYDHLKHFGDLLRVKSGEQKCGPHVVFYIGLAAVDPCFGIMSTKEGENGSPPLDLFNQQVQTASTEARGDPQPGVHQQEPWFSKVKAA